MDTSNGTPPESELPASARATSVPPANVPAPAPRTRAPPYRRRNRTLLAAASATDNTEASVVSALLPLILLQRPLSTELLFVAFVTTRFQWRELALVAASFAVPGGLRAYRDPPASGTGSAPRSQK
ncbi:hypothetical protein ACH4SP_03490 [Streptomyces sp. NPDC021093]|uniref:hypothetical protein n=1 Tax=Streptomyces sp. NPDC021093 TaxID=3365112 RepID=UPI0037AB0748